MRQALASCLQSWDMSWVVDSLKRKHDKDMNQRVCLIIYAGACRYIWVAWYTRVVDSFITPVKLLWYCGWLRNQQQKGWLNPYKSWDVCHLSTGDSDFATIHRKNGGFHKCGYPGYHHPCFSQSFPNKNHPIFGLQTPPGQIHQTPKGHHRHFAKGLVAFHGHILREKHPSDGEMMNWFNEERHW